MELATNKLAEELWRAREADRDRSDWVFSFPVERASRARTQAEKFPPVCLGPEKSGHRLRDLVFDFAGGLS